MAPDLNSVPLSPRVDLSKEPKPNLEKSLPSPPEQYHPTKKPNILYIMADQLSAPLLKIHSSSSPILTPNLDTLASKSIIFESAYSPSPLCAPSRMSMVTGQLPTRIGSYDNACSIDPAIPTYAHYLRKEGYETVLAGKMHFTGEQLHGYEKRLTPDIYPADYGWSVDWEAPGERLEWYHNASSVVQAGTCVRSNQLDYDEEVMYRFVCLFFSFFLFFVCFMDEWPCWWEKGRPPRQWLLEGQRSVIFFLFSFMGASPQTPGLAALESSSLDVGV
jgi:hypothetical protein